jgi:hypothetical protein
MVALYLGIKGISVWGVGTSCSNLLLLNRVPCSHDSTQWSSPWNPLYNTSTGAWLLKWTPTNAFLQCLPKFFSKYDVQAARRNKLIRIKEKCTAQPRPHDRRKTKMMAIPCTVDDLWPTRHVVCVRACVWGGGEYPRAKPNIRQRWAKGKVLYLPCW